MFPFTLDGPQFLTFYLGLAAAVLAALWLRRRFGGGAATGEGRGSPRIDALAQDPYLVACLRGGEEEAIRVAVVNLVDRGLLVPTVGTRLGVTLEGSAELPRRDLDRAILQRCRAAPMTPADLASDRSVRAVTALLNLQLQRQGLRRTEADLAQDRWLRHAGLWLLAGLAVARMAQALARGRTNLEFLVILALGALFLVHRWRTTPMTARGQRMMTSLQTLMQRLRARADRLVPGGATNEAALLAAVFGIHALPAAAFDFVDKTYPKPPPTQDRGSSSDSGGSSCSSGSTCSSGDSSGCGGGGGCGGCGSD